ncbi:1,4-beta-xylanase [Mycolicibacterium sp. 050158]|uniref:1,4-beta-xylanase n=1 Tax=Mycolicibacterium sp. 050158 TaxID=3090602 RepID=UPI00299DAC18|nr:1,4-beta-xylanase [Mycolicibacterium sp. 050158]MDX1892091.1 1,4-beta-xylanase [Mycolicibacterium sp. 050158]
MVSNPEPGSRPVQRRTALKVPLVLAGGATIAAVPRAGAVGRGRWSADRAGTWYRAQRRLVGANYIPANAINQLEMFQPATYDPRRIDAELGLARNLGLNTLRVFLHDLLWVQDRRGFMRRLMQFVTIAASHAIKPLFVFFDSCWDPHPKAGPQKAPVPGVHNSGWVQSPGADRLGDPRYRDVLEEYVTGVLTQFRTDDRILGWDLWNEPDNPASVYRAVERPDKEVLVADLLPQVFDWARAVDPIQPLTSGVWQGTWADPGRRSVIAGIQLDNSDVISFHSYAGPADFEGRIGELAPLQRPILCTEYLARTLGSSVEGILPVATRHGVGAFNWGLVAGKTQTYLPWDSWDRPDPAPPKVWFSDLLQLDGRPYRDSEVRTIRRVTPLLRAK